MASLDSLPADQRAVLQLVLERGKGYDEIGRMLSIDRAGVRQRALAAFDALGPQTGISPERRALITDYLLGQLPPRVSDDMRDRLARTPTERAWAQVLASELAPLARDPLPQIAVEAPENGASEPPAALPAATAQSAASPPTDVEQGEQRAAETPRGETPGAETPRPSSRVGGAVLLALGALIVAAVVLVVLLTTGSSGKKRSSTAAASTTTAASTSARTSATSPTTPTTTSTTSGRVVAQVNLKSPSGGSALGVAQVVRVGNATGIVIVATGIPANTKHDAYAVWLSNSPSDSQRVGFVNPGVSTSGRLQTAGALPANASRYKQVLLTLETQQHPTAPGKIVLQGTLKLR